MTKEMTIFEISNEEAYIVERTPNDTVDISKEFPEPMSIPDAAAIVHSNLTNDQKS